MTERKVRSLRTPDRTPTTEREAPLWVFLFELAYYNAANCGLIPPLQCLNALFKSGRSAEATWEPFEISAAEYASLVAQLVNPDRSALKASSAPHWQSFVRDPLLDQYTDYAEWQKKAAEKHGAAWGMKMAIRQHQMVTGTHKSKD